MIQYFLLIALPLLVRIVSQTYRITTRKRVLYETKSGSIDIFMLLFLLLLALRGLQCGVDTRQYLRLYNEYSSRSFWALFRDYDHEFCYKLLNWLIGNVVGSYQAFLLAASVICVYPLWYFYKRESENQLLTIALFLTVSPFMMYFSGIRQAWAMSIGVFTWYAVKNKKLVWFVAIVLIAMQFHTSAFMLFLMYPLYYAKITKKWLWFVVPCMVAVYIFRTPIFNFLFTLLWQEYDATDATGAVTILILLIMFGLYSYILQADQDLDKDTIALRNILLLSIVIQIFAMLHPLSMRMNYYFLLFTPILIPKIANRSKKRFSQIAQLSVLVMTVYFIYYFLNGVITDNDALNIYPYIPFWKN